MLSGLFIDMSFNSKFAESILNSLHIIDQLPNCYLWKDLNSKTLGCTTKWEPVFEIRRQRATLLRIYRNQAPATG